MLIQGLCDYYDILAKAGKVLPSGYSNVKIHYLVSLTEEGKIDEIINYQKKEEIAAAKGKVKEKRSDCCGLGCCCGTGSIPGPGTSTCHRCGQKQTE